MAAVTIEAVGCARVVTVSRPERRNALDPATLTELRDAAKSLRADPGCRGIVLTGDPSTGVFLSGGDLQALASVRTAGGAKAMAAKAHSAVDMLRSVGVPLLAAVRGDTYGGGCELATACDYRVAEEGVRFQWVQLRFAVTTGWGGASGLLDLVPRGTAMRWLLSAESVTAEEAKAEGFVDALVPKGEAMDHALRFIEGVGRHPKGAVRRMLTLLRESGRMQEHAARRLEGGHFARAWASTEHHAAVERFLSRRG